MADSSRTPHNMISNNKIIFYHIVNKSYIILYYRLNSSHSQEVAEVHRRGSDRDERLRAAEPYSNNINSQTLK